MKQQLEIIQRQKQKFSSKLVPSMEILRLAQYDLKQLVDASLEDNPFADVEEDTSQMEVEEMDVDFKTVRKKQGDLSQLDIEDEHRDTLSDYVLPQLYPYMQTKKDEEVFSVILDSLDTRGFLNETKENLCAYLQISGKKFEEYLHIVQHVEPKGLGAVNYRECILIQLSETKDSALAQSIVTHYLEDVFANDLQKIAKAEHTSLKRVQEAIAFIRSLNPIPANGFRVSERVLYIIPDVYIKRGDHTVSIEMNAKLSDRLKINEENLCAYKSCAFDEESKAFLKKKLDDFKWLQYSVARRSAAIKKIITFLAEYQLPYFLSGNEKTLKPLRLIDIAKALNMHYSTISRAIANKYFQCEYGTFSFRFLIPRCYEKQGEVSASIETIKNEIMEMIKTENKDHPYSDERIHELLEEEGFSVSRRTVTLYRSEAGIPSSRSRRRRKD